MTSPSGQLVVSIAFRLLGGLKQKMELVNLSVEELVSIAFRLLGGLKPY